MDRTRVCTGYWDSRPYSRPQMQILQLPQLPDNGVNLERPSEEQKNPGASGDKGLTGRVDTLLRDLFKKANFEELHSLCSILSDKRPPMDIALVARLLCEEIQSRCG